MLKSFVLVSGNERNAVNATLKEGRGSTCYMGETLFICGLSEVSHKIMTEHAASRIRRTSFSSQIKKPTLHSAYQTYQRSLLSSACK